MRTRTSRGPVALAVIGGSVVLVAGEPGARGEHRRALAGKGVAMAARRAVRAAWSRGPPAVMQARART